MLIEKDLGLNVKLAPSLINVFLKAVVTKNWAGQKMPITDSQVS